MCHHLALDFVYDDIGSTIVLHVGVLMV
jgi:hypothetical protein